MGLIVAIDLVVVGALVAIALTKGFEQALPLFAFILILAPGESTIPLPGLFDLTTQRVAIMTLGVLYCAVGNRNVEAKKYGVPLGYLLLFTLGWNLVSTMNSVVFTTSLKTVFSNIFDFYLVYYIFTKTVSDARTVHRILIAFVSGLTICCVFGWCEAYLSWRIVDLFPTTAYRFTPGQDGLMEDAGDRIRSTFPHAILFANGLALGIPMALYLLTLAKSSLQKVFLGVSILLMFWNIYKTMSRGPWLALVISLILLLLLAQRKIRRYLLVIAVLTISVLVIRPGVWETLKNTYFETFDPDSARGESYEYRYTLMRVGREALAKDLGRAAWGFGPESFYYLGFTGEDPDTGHTVKFDSCDSALVELMVDTGYIGLLLVIVLLSKATLVSWWGFMRLPKRENSICLLFFINLVAYSFMMMSVMNFGWGQQTHMLWMILAVSVVYPHLAGAKASSKNDVVVASRQTGWEVAGVASL